MHGVFKNFQARPKAVIIAETGAVIRVLPAVYETLGMRHKAEHVAFCVADAGYIVGRAVRIQGVSGSFAGGIRIPYYNLFISFDGIKNSFVHGYKFSLAMRNRQREYIRQPFQPEAAAFSI